MALEKVGLQAVIAGMSQFSAASDQIDRTYDKLSQGSERAAGRMSKLGDIAKTAIGFAVGSVAVSAVKGLATSLVGLVASAAPLKDMEDAFGKLTASYDINSGKMIESMRSASKGTIADADLIASANKALIGSGQELGKEFGQALPKLLEMARASAKATGQDVGFLFESLVLGIKRSSPMIIDNTGLQLKLGEAQEKYAASLGKSTMVRVDNTQEIGKSSEKLTELQAQLRLARIRQSEFTDKTKESTRVSAQMRIDKLTQQIAEQQGQVAGLSKAHGTLAKAAKGAEVELSAEQKQIALLRATLEAGEGMVAAMGSETLTTTEKMARMRTTVANLRNQFAKALLPILDVFLDMLAPIAETLAAKIVPAMERTIMKITDFAVALRSFSIGGFAGRLWESLAPEWLQARLLNLVGFLRDLGGVFEGFREGGIWTGIVRIGEMLTDAFGEGVTKIFYRFIGALDELTGRIRAWWETGPIGRLLQTIREGWATRIAGPVANWWEQSGLKARFEGLIGRIRDWWQAEGGISGILDTIKTGWATRIAGPVAEWWATSGLKARFEEIHAGISTWWESLGAEEGALGKIGAGWEKYIAEPLENFWGKSLQEKFDAIKSGLTDWVEVSLVPTLQGIQARISSAITDFLRIRTPAEQAEAAGLPEWYEQYFGPRSEVLDALAKWIEGIARWIGEVGVPSLLDALEAIGDAIIAAIFGVDVEAGARTPLEEAILKGIRDIGSRAWTAFVEGFKEGMKGRITLGFEEAGITILTEEELEKLQRTMAETGQQTMRDVLRETHDPRRLGDSARAWWSAFTDVFFKKGKEQPALESAKEAGKRLGESAIEGTKDALEMESPSLVYRQIGVDMADGMAQGTQSLESIGMLSEAIRSLTDWANAYSYSFRWSVSYTMGQSMVRGIVSGILSSASIQIMQNALRSLWAQTYVPRPVVPRLPITEPWPGYQYGGIVPGPAGRPQLGLLHGGEEVLTLQQRQRVAAILGQAMGGAMNVSVPAATSMQRLATYQTTNVWSPQVNASYQQVQSPTGVMQDMETLAILYRLA